jgi:hypothetical protein
MISQKNDTIIIYPAEGGDKKIIYTKRRYYRLFIRRENCGDCGKAHLAW